ncbi:MAG: fused MFS/spermidine synthase [Pseudomonadota bacterium]|nr:fused MFS/spermidine synthase [Pseudomonadota bacterium]
MNYDGTIIHSARDEFGLVEVVDNKVTRKLYFDSPIEQSCIFLNAPMSLNFEYQEKITEQVLNAAQKRKPNQDLRVLMLGMGGGSMAHQLFHALPNLQMTVVELRQIVIDCAYQFFQLPNEPEVDVIQEDAIQFVAENHHQYDVVIVDIFDAHGLPSQLSDVDFQQNLFQNLNSTGLLIFNLWNEMSDSGSGIPTAETKTVVNYWQQQVEDRQDIQLNKYNIQSSSNLILTLQR